MKEFQTFVRHFSDLAPGRHVLFIKDLTPGPRKYDTRLVKAEVSNSPARDEGWDVLWLRSEAGQRLDQAHSIKILEEMGEVVDGGPYDDVFLITQALTAELG